MPRSRKTEDMSPPTMLRWLKVYLTEVVKMIEEDRIYREEGLKVAKGLRYSIRALEISATKYKRARQVAREDEYKDAAKRLEEMVG